MILRALVLLPLISASPAAADCAASLAGDYVCAYGCRPTDANPRIEVDGGQARCWNELGGLFVGRLKPPDAVACFHKIGTLSCDGSTIRWSDGVIWKRH